MPKTKPQAQATKGTRNSTQDYLDAFNKLVESGMEPPKAVTQVAEDYGVTRGAVYTGLRIRGVQFNGRTKATNINRDVIVDALNSTPNMDVAAKNLDISVATLRNQMKSHSIDRVVTYK